jgi:nucleoside phosphorylase
VRICDVVVADQIDDYLARARAKTGENHSFEFELSGKAYRPDVRLLNMIKYLKFDHPDMHKRLSSESQADIQRLGNRMDEELVASGLIGKEFELHCGPVASGDIVAASADFCRWLLGRDRKYRAIEMEAAGVMSEIYESAGDERVMVLRGISDCSDERKAKLDQTTGGSVRAIALRNAIRLLWSLFEVI